MLPNKVTASLDKALNPFFAGGHHRGWDFDHRLAEAPALNRRSRPSVAPAAPAFALLEQQIIGVCDERIFINLQAAIAELGNLAEGEAERLIVINESCQPMAHEHQRMGK